MLKKTMTYTDFEGVERTEDFYFNLTRAEVTEMEMSEAGGLPKMIKKIVDAQDAKQIIATFKDLILRAYGEKSPDGRRFMKSTELSTAFSQTNAFSDLFMELSMNSDAAADFVNGIMPVIKTVEPMTTT